MQQNNFQPQTLFRRETLLLDLRDVIQENIQPLVKRARTEISTSTTGRNFSNYNSAGLLAEAIDKLNELCLRIDTETAGDNFLSRIHQALGTSTTQNTCKFQITGSTVLTTIADQEMIIKSLQRISALCKNSACCLKSIQLIMAANEHRLILTTSQESTVQAEIFQIRLKQILESDKISVVRTILIDNSQSVHMVINQIK
jgi:hypothetical protein